MSDELPLFIRLYLDEDVHKRVAAALRLRHFNAISVYEVGRWGLSDEEQLAYAAIYPPLFGPPPTLRQPSGPRLSSAYSARFAPSARMFGHGFH